MPRLDHFTLICEGANWNQSVLGNLCVLENRFFKIQKNCSIFLGEVH